MKYEKAELIAQGKTKNIFAVKDNSKLVIIQNKDDITAFDDASFTKKFASKGEYATNTTCRIFELLEAAGIPVAYRKQISPTEFLAEKCYMIPLEVVARRFAVGSYLKRHPELYSGKDEIPHRFHQLVVEFFLKTTNGKLLVTQEQGIVIEGLNPKKGEEDPFIINPYEGEWHLFHPKKPSWDPKANLKKPVLARKIIGNYYEDRIENMENILRKVFLVIEGAWNTIGLRIIDMKIEFGSTADGLVVADVIDNDSWRLRTHDWKELSKQTFRDGESLSDVEKKYGTVAKLTERFRVPNQALVLWQGSDKDPRPELDPKFDDMGCSIEEVTLSGHKSPAACIAKLEAIIAKYPDGGAIIVKVGRSNGLGPLLAARTSWPVIAIPATADKFPDDIWSSIRMPSKVPLSTAWPEENAIGQAINILSQKNPVLYMWNQKQIEDLDG